MDVSRTPLIAPSLLSADFARLAEEAQRVADADWLHFDVMDAHFVPNLTLGLPVVEAIQRTSPVPLDCHLMIEAPERWAPGYAEALDARGRLDWGARDAIEPTATGSVGDTIAEGDTVVILESMKMEMPVEAEDEGVVKEIRCEEGQAVSEGDTLIVLE